MSKGLQPVGGGADDHIDRDACGKKDRGHRHAVFFEDIFDPLSKRYGSFSFLNLRSQQSKLIFSLCDSFLGSHSFRRRSVLIFDERYVFFILVSELSLLFIQFIEGFRNVKPFFKSVSVLFFRREGASESVNPRLFLFFVFTGF